jgi:hypothetical protein
MSGRLTSSSNRGLAAPAGEPPEALPGPPLPLPPAVGARPEGPPGLKLPAACDGGPGKMIGKSLHWFSLKMSALLMCRYPLFYVLTPLFTKEHVSYLYQINITGFLSDKQGKKIFTQVILVESMICKGS